MALSFHYVLGTAYQIIYIYIHAYVCVYIEMGFYMYLCRKTVLFVLHKIVEI